MFVIIANSRGTSKKSNSVVVIAIVIMMIEITLIVTKYDKDDGIVT